MIYSYKSKEDTHNKRFYTEYEDKIIMSRVYGGNAQTMKQVAAILNRSVEGVQSRRRYLLK